MWVAVGVLIGYTVLFNIILVWAHQRLGAPGGGQRAVVSEDQLLERQVLLLTWMYTSSSETLTLPLLPTCICFVALLVGQGFAVLRGQSRRHQTLLAHQGVEFYDRCGHGYRAVVVGRQTKEMAKAAFHKDLHSACDSRRGYRL